MKKVVMLCAVLIACTDPLPETEEAAADAIQALYESDAYVKAVDLADRALEQFGRTERLLAKKYKVLLAQEEYEGALETFESIIDIAGEHPNIVIDKVRLQKKLERYEEALQTAERMYNLFPAESPYICLEACRITNSLGRTEEAIAWLERSVDQGFNDFEFLLREEFAPLHEGETFQRLTERMKRDAGIGLPVTPFTTTLMNGGTFDLAETRGKVVLIDFWATWCVPCVAEHPNLTRMYDGYKDDGFEIVSVSADGEEDAVRRFEEEHPMPWVHGFSGMGRKDAVVQLYGIDSFPTYILVDRDGIVQYAGTTGGTKLSERVASVMGYDL
jgi:thiol-disulfide isomerase/thioredoxin